MPEAVTSTIVHDAPAIQAALEAGQYGAAVGLVLMLVVTTLRKTRVTALFDGTGAVIAGAAAATLVVVGEELIRGVPWLTIVLAAIQTAVPMLLPLFVKPNPPVPR